MDGSPSYNMKHSPSMRKRFMSKIRRSSNEKPQSGWPNSNDPKVRSEVNVSKHTRETPQNRISSLPEHNKRPSTSQFEPQTPSRVNGQAQYTTPGPSYQAAEDVEDRNWEARPSFQDIEPRGTRNGETRPSYESMETTEPRGWEAGDHTTARNPAVFPDRVRMLTEANRHLKRINDDWGRAYDELKEEKDQLLVDYQILETETAKQVEGYNQDLAQKNAQIERLRTKLTRIASKASHLPPQRALQLPQSEIVNRWRNLGFKVDNFVANDLDTKSPLKLARWIGKEEVQLMLRKVTLNARWHIEKKNGEILVRAVLWSALYKEVFGGLVGKGSLCWAGNHSAKLRRLTASFLKRIHPDDSTMATFHQWKALTTNLIKAINPIDSRNENIAIVTEELEDILSPLRPRFGRDTMHDSLMQIVRDAVDLDEIFWGQEEWYYVRYPKARYDTPFEKTSMTPVDGRRPGRKVLVVVRPGLFCQGVNGREYARGAQLDNHRVL